MNERVKAAIATHSAANRAFDEARRASAEARIALFDALAESVPPAFAPGADVELAYRPIIRKVSVVGYKRDSSDIVLIAREYLKDGALGVEKSFPWHRLPSALLKHFEPLRHG